jgi:DNA-binding GntR family transcriptional regulator
LELDAVSLAFKNVGKPTIVELKSINNDLKSLMKSSDLDRIHSLDHQFHYIVFRAARNDALFSSIEFVKSSFSSYALWRRPGRLKQSIAEHAEFIAALESGDCDAGVRAHQKHLESGLRAALAGTAESDKAPRAP